MQINRSAFEHLCIGYPIDDYIFRKVIYYSLSVTFADILRNIIFHI